MTNAKKPGRAGISRTAQLGQKSDPWAGTLRTLMATKSRDRIKRGCWGFLDFPALPLARGDVSMQAIFFCPQGQATP